MTDTQARTDPVRKPRQLRSLNRVERIKSAARSLIEQKGCGDLTIGDIAGKAEVSPSSVYQYFPNKEAIIIALAEHYLLSFRTRIAERLSPAPGSRAEMLERLLAVLQEYHDLYASDPVVREIWMRSTTDKALKKLDRDDTLHTLETLHAAARPLFPAEQHDDLRISLLLMIHFGAGAVRASLDADGKESGPLIHAARDMLVVLWTDLSKLHG